MLIIPCVFQKVGGILKNTKKKNDPTGGRQILRRVRREGAVTRLPGTKAADT